MRLEKSKHGVRAVERNKITLAAIRPVQGRLPERMLREMAEVGQPGWTCLRTATGRYEYQFQGEMPTVRGGQYENARDFQFLVLDDEGVLYKIPVRLNTDIASELGDGAL